MRDERVIETVETIRQIMDEALYGWPLGKGDADRATDRAEGGIGARDPGIAFQAQVLNTFRREYGMSYAETEAIPLKRLAQLWREHIWLRAGDKTGLSLMDRDEAAIWREALADNPTETVNG